MRHKTGAILLIGFGALIVLIGIMGLSAFRWAEQIYSEVSVIHDTYRRNGLLLGEIRDDFLLSSVFVRDHLLDSSSNSAAGYRGDLLGIRSSLTERLETLASSISADQGEAIERLRQEIDLYWESLNPIFEWTAQQKIALGPAFLQKNIIPHRNAVLSITREINQINEGVFKKEQEKVDANRKEFEAYLEWIFLISLMVALGVAGPSIFFVARLERISAEQRSRVKHAEQELRRLSQALVQAQEDERKSISCELHDEIGQLLTALKMELGNLEKLRQEQGNEFQTHILEAKTITEEAMGSVRDLAMGLRPSMLDNLGLDPALRWQAREFSHHSGISAAVETEGDLTNLPEPVVTCIYRVTQESLTNCARHAQAANVKISVHRGKERVAVTIQDDGTGFDPGKVRGHGIGLIGMEERVKKLGGSMSISSQALRGTILKVELPINDLETAL